MLLNKSIKKNASCHTCPVDFYANLTITMGEHEKNDKHTIEETPTRL